MFSWGYRVSVFGSWVIGWFSRSWFDKFSGGGDKVRVFVFGSWFVGEYPGQDLVFCRDWAWTQDTIRDCAEPPKPDLLQPMFGARLQTQYIKELPSQPLHTTHLATLALHPMHPPIFHLVTPMTEVGTQKTRIIMTLGIGTVSVSDQQRNKIAVFKGWHTACGRKDRLTKGNFSCPPLPCMSEGSL